MKMKQLIFNLLFRRGKDKMPAIVPGSLSKSRGILGKQARLSNVCFVCFQFKINNISQAFKLHLLWQSELMQHRCKHLFLLSCDQWETPWLNQLPGLALYPQGWCPEGSGMGLGTG